jgi:hypothetical protein
VRVELAIVELRVRVYGRSMKDVARLSFIRGLIKGVTWSMSRLKAFMPSDLEHVVLGGGEEAKYLVLSALRKGFWRGYGLGRLLGPHLERYQE